jgi:HPt (histidine-containing phosphotransfer) domain-containing protein
MVKSDEEMLVEFVETSITRLSKIEEGLGDERNQLGELARKLEGEKGETMQRQVSIGKIETEAKTLGGSLKSLKGLLNGYFRKVAGSQKKMEELIKRLEDAK